MKLIIDIPKETYNNIQSRDWKNGELVFSEEWKVIHNGTLLEEVLQEIRQEITNLDKVYPFTNHMDTYVKEDKVLEIIDKHIK